MSSKRRNQEQVQLLLNHRVDSSFNDEIIKKFYSSIDTPRSLACWLLYSSGEHAQLLELSVNPLNYNDVVAFRDDYQATCFLSKSSFLRPGFDKKQVALAKFLEFEELCGRTNKRFRNLSFDPLFEGSNVWLLNATIRQIERVLGDYSSEELVDESNWGPGVTTLLKGSHVSAYNKFHLENGMTRRLYNFIEPWFSMAYPLWTERICNGKGSPLNSDHFVFEEGNEVITVPKNAKTDRVIAVEPGFNLWFQKGIGSMIRRRLSRVGVNLNDQTRNQQLAESSSISDDLATVDFSSASDSISYEVVRELLPPDWFTLLDVTRSPVGTQNGTQFKWNKFSSMGNGYTFELESLIFFAAAKAVCEYCDVSSQDVSVFGDDVILPSSCFELFRTFCDFLGFKVGASKSFSSGPFRESCGAHFYAGVDCKPIFLKENLTNAQSLYKLANNVRLLAHRRNFGCGCDVKFVRLWHNLLRGVPGSIRFRIPQGFGESGFVSNFDEATPARARFGWEGFLFRGVIEIGLTRSSEELGILLARLRSQSPLEYRNTYTLRGRTRIKIATILAHQWYDLGPWV